MKNADKTELENFAETHPHLANEWHPTKNEKLTAREVTAKSLKRVWWKCPKGSDHEWETRVTDRVRGPRCAFCLNQRLSVTNNLKTLHPKLVIKWHPTKNGDLTPETIIGTGQHRKYWWKCTSDPSHEWEASVFSHVRKDGTYRDCPLCKSTPLAGTHPEIAAQWHPTKNKSLTPNHVVAGSATRAWWKCMKGEDHEWNTKIVERLKTGCPFCDGKKLSTTNSLETRYPHLAKEWHPTKNGDLHPNQVFGGGKKKYWWKCNKEADHEWEASIQKRADGQGCSICRGLKVVSSNCLANTHPELTTQWHPTKNGSLTAYDVIAGSSTPIWWLCQKNPEHEWETSCKNRTKSGKNEFRSCPFCSNHKVCKSNSLASTNPELTKEWHPTKNGDLTFYDVTEGSGVIVWWQCSKNAEHEWQAHPASRKWGNGCPICNTGWTVDKIRSFIRSLLPHLEHLTPAELYVIFQQNGILNLQSKSRTFLQALRTGKFPKEELEKFVNGEQSLVDEFIENSDKRIDQLSENLEGLSAVISEEETASLEEELPFVETKDILAALSNKIISNIDREAIEFFANSAVAKIWHHAFINEKVALNQLSECPSDPYSQEIKARFLEQYEGAKNLTIPSGYNFKVNGELSLPNLMQRFTAFMMKTRKRLGNWSGTGAGKTLSAILSSRVIDARFTLICCPNSVVGGWKNNIEAIYPDSVVFSKETKITLPPNKHSYLILNYEFFQQSQSESKLKDLVENQKIDFVVIDEIHYSKQRVVDDISKRKKVISALLSEAAKKNDSLHVLGMSATPVINNLFEGKTLIELITGVLHDDLNTKPSVGNCIALYQKLVSTGIRWLPRYHQKIDVRTVEVDCGSYLEEIKNVSLQGSMADLEAVLTTAKIQTILENLKPKTIVYTHYLKDILIPLKEAIELQGWKTAIFTGDDKSGLEEFIKFDADVLIASSCLGTGVDGLQHVCNRIIINTLPWTHAEFEQLKGRVYRQGQKSDHVDIIVPLTYANVNGERWSWCDSRWKRILFKKSIADAAVDGVIPEGHLRTPAQAYQDAMNWLKRLEEGKLHEIERHKINLQLSEAAVQQGLRKFGDFSKMNHQLNSSSSATTNKKFQQHPEDWEYYHSMYREARKEWAIVPYKEAAKWCKARPHLVVGDFGCGEALLAQEIENKVHSFDHVAVNEDVTSCDIAHVPLDDDSLDAAIFSLSLMGTNYIDYIKEAHRCLKLDGHLWIAETTSRYQSLSFFEEELSKIGFDLVRKQEKGSFTFLRLIKSDRSSSAS
jgi:superfamily II DNA or RNA helicase